MKLRSIAVRAHRWLSLIAVAFWLLQAATGVFAVFHWEIDDATVAGPHRATDLAAIESRLFTFAPTGSGRSIGSIWTSAGAPDRYDVSVRATPPDSGHVLRIDGVGNILRSRNDGERFASGGLADTLIELHHELLADDTGKVIVGTSGVLLFSNLLMGIVIAWPRRGQWKRTLMPARAGTRVAWLFSWHRALGLWVALPALLLVSAGVMMAFEETTEKLLKAAPIEAPSHPPTGPPRVGMVVAVRIAQAGYPGSVVSGIGFPSTDQAAWKITLKQKGERRRAYGKTRLFISANDGRILATFDALQAPPGRRMADNLFALHTGEVGGRVGRAVVLLIGVWLIGMIFMGLSLWWTRRTALLPHRRPPST